MYKCIFYTSLYSRPFSNIDEDLEDVEYDGPSAGGAGPGLDLDAQQLRQEVLSSYQQVCRVGSISIDIYLCEWMFRELERENESQKEEWDKDIRRYIDKDRQREPENRNKLLLPSICLHPQIIYGQMHKMLSRLRQKLYSLPDHVTWRVTSSGPHDEDGGKKTTTICNVFISSLLMSE